MLAGTIFSHGQDCDCDKRCEIDLWTDSEAGTGIVMDYAVSLARLGDSKVEEPGVNERV
jgi:hypothetical protein